MELVPFGLALWSLAQYGILLKQTLEPMLASTAAYPIALVIHFVAIMMIASLYFTTRTDPGVVPWDTRCHGHYRVGSPLNLPVTSKGDNLASPEVYAAHITLIGACSSSKPAHTPRCRLLWKFDPPS